MGLLMWRDYTSNQSYYPSYDLNGNVTGLLNSSGVYVAWYEYAGFGKVLTEGGAMKDSNPMRYSTQYTDDDAARERGDGEAAGFARRAESAGAPWASRRQTGLVYYGLRYYDPGKGRFLNRDPIGESGGMNLYRFVGNNPVDRVDVWGLGKYATVTTDDEMETYMLEPFQVRASYSLENWLVPWVKSQKVDVRSPGSGGSSRSGGSPKSNPKPRPQAAPVLAVWPRRRNCVREDSRRLTAPAIESQRAGPSNALATAWSPIFSRLAG